MYFIRIESFVFSDISQITNSLAVLKSSFSSVLFCFVVEIQVAALVGRWPVVKAAERQI